MPLTSNFFSMKTKLFIITLLFLIFIPEIIFAESDPLTINKIIEIALNHSINSDMNKVQEELNDRQYRSIIYNMEPTLSFDFSGPSYTHSISPITQPDGTIKYHDINGLTFTPSLSFSLPVLFSGGTLSIQQNLDFYQTRNAGMTNKNYSVNLYNVSFSQPLNFFKSYKWQKVVAKTSLSVQQLEVIEQNVAIKQDVVKLFFNILSANDQIKTYAFEKKSLNDLLMQYNNLYKQHKVIQTDVQDIDIKILQIENNIESSKNDLKEAEMKLNTYLRGRINVNNVHMVCPVILYIQIDDSLAFRLLNEKQEIYEKAMKASHESSIAQAKSQRGITASLNLGIGMNSSSDKFSYLWTRKVSNQNLSLSISVPISGWKEKNNQYKIEQLKYKLDSEKNLNNNIEEQIELKSDIQELKNNQKMYDFLLKKSDLIQKKLQIQQDLFKENKILFDELERTLDSYYQVKNDIISTIGNSYAIYYSIENLLLYDFLFGSSYMS